LSAGPAKQRALEKREWKFHRIPVKRFTSFTWNSQKFSEWAEALFCLDFLVTFLSKKKVNARPA
jgi:hypothetical protein